MAVGGQGFLNAVADKARMYSDESLSSSRFSDANILEMIRRACADVLDDVNRVSTMKIRARCDIAISAETREHALPPCIGAFLEFKKLDTNGHIEWEEKARHPLSPWGPGFMIEGPMLYVDPYWASGETMRIDYLPTGEPNIFECTSAATTASTIKAAASPTAGSVDLHTNAYLGHVVRVLSCTEVTQQDRVISSEDRTTPAQPIFTVKPDFSPTPTGTVIFEVLPWHVYRYEDVIALRVARFIASITGDRERRDNLILEYEDALSKLKLRAHQTQQTTLPKMHRVRRSRHRFGKTI